MKVDLLKSASVCQRVNTMVQTFLSKNFIFHDESQMYEDFIIEKFIIRYWPRRIED